MPAAFTYFPNLFEWRAHMCSGVCAGPCVHVCMYACMRLCEPLFIILIFYRIDN